MRVMEGACVAYSDSVEISKDGVGSMGAPQVSVEPSTGELCGPDATVTLTVNNATDYENALYYLIKDKETIIVTSESPVFEIQQEGTYFIPEGLL